MIIENAKIGLGLPGEVISETPEKEEDNKVSIIEDTTDNKVSDDDTTESDELEDEVEANTDGIPRLPKRLHPAIKAIVEPYPNDRKEVMAMMSLPFLGMLGGNAKFLYRNVEEHYPGFECCLVGEQSVGKSALTRMANALISKVKAEDKKIRQKKDEYNDACLEAGDKGQKPKNPHLGTRIMMPDTTKSQFNQNIKDLKGKRAIIIAPEIDSLARGNSWCNDHGVNERLMFDTEEGGQDTKTAGGTNAMVPIAVNLATSGTPVAVFRHYKNAEDGLVTRIAFCSFPHYMDKNKEERPRSAKNLAALEAIQDKLLAIPQGDAIAIPELKRQQLKWCEEKEAVSLASGNQSIETFRKRAAVMGFRAGGLLYMLDDLHLTRYALDFALWVSEYVLYFQLKYFGQKMNDSIAQNAEIMEAPVKVNDRSTWKFVQLPAHFTRDQFIQFCKDNGFKGTGYRQTLSRYVNEKHWLVKNADKTYSKTAEGLALGTAAS